MISISQYDRLDVPEDKDLQFKKIKVFKPIGNEGNLVRLLTLTKTVFFAIFTI